MQLRQRLPNGARNLKPESVFDSSRCQLSAKLLSVCRAIRGGMKTEVPEKVWEYSQTPHQKSSFPWFFCFLVLKGTASKPKKQPKTNFTQNTRGGGRGPTFVDSFNQQKRGFNILFCLVTFFQHEKRLYLPLSFPTTKLTFQHLI